MSLFLFPSTWALLVMVAVALWVGKATRLVAIGLLCYTLSYALSNAYTLAIDYGVAIEVWQAGLLSILLMYAIVARTALSMGLFFAAFAALSLHLTGYAGRRGFELLVMLFITVAVFSIYRRIPFSDTISKLVWAVILVAEGWAAFEYAGCQFASQPDVSELAASWGVTVDKYSCGRAFGPVAPYVAPAITTLYLIWIGIRWNQHHRPKIQ